MFKVACTCTLIMQYVYMYMDNFPLISVDHRCIRIYTDAMVQLQKPSHTFIKVFKLNNANINLKF